MNAQPAQEIRFAVVMYGGVSLAIYMNGIAQELLRAVRATSDLDATLSGAELVYRELGRRLFRGRTPGDSTLFDTVATRIVVDVLSGTSAGGINAVFLAKALAGGNRDLDLLRRMWFDEADLDKLLNDRGSEPRLYPNGPVKTSLLNGRRMLAKLLDAFRGMDNPSLRDSPLADELDLFVTATDLHGLPAPITLTDVTIQEKIHQAVFHFRYDKDLGINDLETSCNPMLAFASRATSSFPVAFEPVRLADLGLTPELKQKYKPFFARYAAMGIDNWETRPFADGGYLDNKPFSYALEAIPHREATLPYERKLLFIDPFPEQNEPIPGGAVDFLSNAMLAYRTLPAYETIRGDIDWLNRRNRVQARLAALQERILSGRNPRPLQDNRERYPNLDLNDMVGRFGETYRVYHHLRVYAVTDWISTLATNIAGLNPDSDAWHGIRSLVRAWRDRRFSASRTPGLDTENRFLFRFDIDFRIRRLRHLLNVIDNSAQHLHAHRALVLAQLKILRRSKAQLESLIDSPLRALPEKTIDESVLDAMAAELDRNLKHVLAGSSQAMRGLPLPLLEAYRQFEDYDMITLPFLEGSGVEPFSPVQVFRISPGDSTLLTRQSQKLAGYALHHFGAFLSRGWRENDMIWGRLDGAERIIHACLPDPRDAALRHDLTARAWKAILEEEFHPARNNRLMRWASDELSRAVPKAARGGLASALAQIAESPVFSGIGFLDFFRHYYQMPAGPPPEKAIEWAARATRILGEMFHGLGIRSSARLRLAGSLLTMLVRFSLPNSLGSLLLTHWLQLALLASALLIITGPYLQPGLSKAGWTGASAACLLLFLRAILARWFRGDSRWLTRLKNAALAASATLAALGAWTLYSWLRGLLANLPGCGR